MMPLKLRSREHRAPCSPVPDTTPALGDLYPEEGQLPGHWQDFVCAQLANVGMTTYR